ncbi:PREDICTED: uncharacterized protein LOC108769272 [Trachymyrmex cornetzi]|uniref:uncharacterized protein LOC108769272 n=1 Tax=Trachymyrmex cornetzi TaxID=471704 RepID=UPI00084F2F6A|nr:PREDICTED: uncharacterized protein LOC108769272 [Trachymyrmex cornetzi]
MKFSYVIFICSLVTTSAVIDFTLNLKDSQVCDPGQWIITNTIIEWKNSTKMISCNITYNELNDSTIYRIHIIMNCEDINSNCTNEPIIWIDDIDCNDSQNLSLSDMDVCKISQELGKWERQKELFEYRYGYLFGDMLYRMILCINIEDIESEINFV